MANADQSIWAAIAGNDDVVLVEVKLPSSTVDKIDRVSSSREDFIVSAVSAALDAPEEGDMR